MKNYLIPQSKFLTGKVNEGLISDDDARRASKWIPDRGTKIQRNVKVKDEGGNSLIFKTSGDDELASLKILCAKSGFKYTVDIQ